MAQNIEDMRVIFDEIMENLRFVERTDIPNIELYMDQVTSFMDEWLAQSSRDPAADKILTKTMINNYVKNKVLVPPVRKKYSVDHMIMLILIFYLKSFLSINDVGEVLDPLKEKFSQKEGYTLKDIYDEVGRTMKDVADVISREVEEDLRIAEHSFADAPEEDREKLQRFDLICRMSLEIYFKKLFIERLIDEQRKEDEMNGLRDKRSRRNR